MTRRLVNVMDLPPKGQDNPFRIDIAHNPAMGCHDLMLQVGGLKDETEAKEFAELLASWLVEEGGWKAKVQAISSHQ